MTKRREARSPTPDEAIGELAVVYLAVEEHRLRWGARPSKPSGRLSAFGGFDSYLFRHYPKGGKPYKRAYGDAEDRAQINFTDGEPVYRGSVHHGLRPLHIHWRNESPLETLRDGPGTWDQNSIKCWLLS